MNNVVKATVLATEQAEATRYDGFRNARVCIYATMAGLLLLWLQTSTPAAKANGSSETSRIAFCSFRDGNYEVYAVHLSSSEATNLTQHTAMDGSPSWSPDGTKLAFASTRDGNLEIYTLATSTGLSTRLTNNQFPDNSPKWSPDDTQIMFVSERDGNSEVYVMNADGTAQKRLTRNGYFDGTPDWSRDGHKIAFSSERWGLMGIYVMNADGTGETQVTARNDGDPAWSPDGRLLAFSSAREGDPEIYAMKPDGTSVRQLTDNTAVDGAPAWSPDGKGIAFMSNRDGNDEIYIMNADGTAQRNLTQNRAVDSYPAWGPNSSEEAQQTRHREEKKRGGGEQRVTVTPLTEFAVAHWWPTNKRNRVVYMNDYSGEAYFKPYFVGDHAAEAGSLWKHARTGLADSTMAIDSSILRRIEVVMPQPSEIEEDARFSLFFRVTMKNNVFFFADMAVKRFEYDTEIDGFAAHVDYKFPQRTYQYKHSDDKLKEVIRAIRFPTDRDAPVSVEYIGGRKDTGTNWRFIVGSRANWNPTSDVFCIRQESVTLKIPLKDIIQISRKPQEDYTVVSLVSLADGRTVRGSIDTTVSADMWRGSIDIDGVVVDIEAPYSYIAVVRPNEVGPGKGSLRWNDGCPVFFANSPSN